MVRLGCCFSDHVILLRKVFSLCDLYIFKNKLYCEKLCLVQCIGRVIKVAAIAVMNRSIIPLLLW